MPLTHRLQDGTTEKYKIKSIVQHLRRVSEVLQYYKNKTNIFIRLGFIALHKTDKIWASCKEFKFLINKSVYE